jgi:lambda repressor-like predicted transcriptional regulator
MWYMRHVDAERHTQIKLRLRANGSSFADIARQLNVRAATVTLVSQGYATSERIQGKIAEELSVPVRELFPERYLKFSEEGFGT